MKRKCGNCPVVLFCVSRGVGEWNKFHCAKCKTMHVFRKVKSLESLDRFIEYKTVKGVNIPKCSLTNYGRRILCEACKGDSDA